MGASDAGERSLVAEQRVQPASLPLQDLAQKGLIEIEGVRAESNITMVFDVSQQGSNILTADKACDLTQRVVDRLKASSAAPAATPAAKKP